METCHGLWCNVDSPPLLSLHIMHMLIDPSSRSLFVPPHFFNANSESYKYCNQCCTNITRHHRERPFFPSLPPSTIFFFFSFIIAARIIASRDYIIGRAHLVQWWASMGAQVVDWAGRVWFKKTWETQKAKGIGDQVSSRACGWKILEVNSSNNPFDTQS